MKKLSAIIILSVLVLLGFPVSAQVDRDELESIDYSGIEFRNYEGPHAKIDTLSDIMGIGVALSLRDSRGAGRYYDKYTILHIAEPQDEKLFNADIMILEPGAGVDHINNIRRILSSYLVSAYSYPQGDALILATFVTYYNAVYRGDYEYFQKHYTPRVLDFLVPEKVGISTRYEDWPGNTQLVVPLSPRQRQGGPALDTDALTDPGVIETLREQEGMGLDERKSMTDIKESEIQREEQDLREKDEAIREKEAELNRARQDVAEAEKELAERQEEDPEEPGLAKEAGELDQEKADLAREEAELAREKEELAERQKDQEARLEQIKEEREQIARDEGTLLAEKEEAKEQPATTGAAGTTPAGTVPFLRLSDRDGILGTLLLVQVLDGKAVKTSGVTTIRGGGFYDYADGFLVIAGEESAERIISLVLLDKKNLEITKSAVVPAAANSRLLIQGPDVYAAVRVDGKWVPGRFNKNLELTGYIDESMAPFSFFNIQSERLIFQDDRGRIKSTALSDMILP